MRMTECQKIVARPHRVAGSQAGANGPDRKPIYGPVQEAKNLSRPHPGVINDVSVEMGHTDF